MSPCPVLQHDAAPRIPFFIAVAAILLVRVFHVRRRLRLISFPRRRFIIFLSFASETYAAKSNFTLNTLETNNQCKWWRSQHGPSVDYFAGPNRSQWNARQQNSELKWRPHLSYFNSFPCYKSCATGWMLTAEGRGEYLYTLGFRCGTEDEDEGRIRNGTWTAV